MNMLELLKQGIFSSIGLASLTQDKIAEIVSEVAKHIPLTEQQAKEFAEEMQKRSEKARSEFGHSLDSQIDHAVIQMGLVKNEIRKASESAQDTLTRFVDERIRASLERLGAAPADELEALKKRIELLERKVAGDH